MTINASFWVAISFFIFLGILIYFKIPQKVKETLDESIFNIKSQINEAEKLREEAENLLSENEKKLSNSKSEIKTMIGIATEEAEKHVLKRTIRVVRRLDKRFEISITHYQPLTAFRKVNLHAGRRSLTFIIQDNTFTKFLM
jgi:F-type H+-transporting ATPase subunit b